MPRVNVKDKRKQQLIDANMTSIARRGLVDTTITHVSDGANMSRGIVNFYFDSKEKMMQETLAFLVQEHMRFWQESLAASAGKPALQKLEGVLQSLMSDKLCSVRRLAVLSAFLGHAGTHVSYARLINHADDLFIKQMKIIWQEAGLEPKAAESKARQMLVIIRGHHVMSFLNPDAGKPSGYAPFWQQVMQVWAADAQPVKEKPAKPPLTVSKPVKKSTNVLPGQLDFGDLFSKV